MKKKLMGIITALSLSASALTAIPVMVSADQLNEGMYNFVCVDGGKYLNVYAGIDADGTNVCVWDKDGSPEQNFKMVDRGGNKYVLYPQSSPSGRVLDANRGNSYSNPLQAGNNIDIWRTNDAPAQEWYIDDRGGGKYTIELVSARGLVVSCDNTGANGGNCSLQSYNGSSNQLWYLQRTDGGAVKPETTVATSKPAPTAVTATLKPVETSSYATGVYSVKYQGTNLRSGPGLDNSVVDTVNSGIQLTVTEVSGEWGKTSYNGQSCWIRLNGFADYVGAAQTVTQATPTPVPATPKPETTRTGYVYNTGGWVLRVRAQANTDCEVLGTVKEGSSITVKGDGTTNGFYKVDFDGRTGYCHSNYITFSKPAESSSGSLSGKLGQRLANFNSAAYNSASPFMNGCDYSGQCTWYCWGRAYEKTGIRLNTIHHANTWLRELNTQGARVVWDSNAPRKDSIAVKTSGAYGHVMYIEDVVGDTVYYTEANVPMNNDVDSNDGILKATSKSGMAGKCNAYIYLN